MEWLYYTVPVMYSLGIVSHTAIVGDILYRLIVPQNVSFNCCIWGSLSWQLLYLQSVTIPNTSKVTNIKYPGWGRVYCDENFASLVPKGCKSGFVTYPLHIVYQAELLLIVKYCFWLIFYPIKICSYNFACTGAIGIQNSCWPLIILFQTPNL